MSPAVGFVLEVRDSDVDEAAPWRPFDRFVDVTECAVELAHICGTPAEPIALALSTEHVACGVSVATGRAIRARAVTA